MLSEEDIVVEARAKLAKPGHGMGKRNRELITALCDEVERLREREQTIVAVNAELIEGNHAAHVALDAAGIKREDVVWEGPIQHVTEYPVCGRIRFLQSQLEELRAENEKLKQDCNALSLALKKELETPLR